MNATLIRWSVGLLVAVAPLAPAALGQDNPCPEPDFLEIWVDPYDGVNVGPAQIGDPTQPARTINFAIQTLRGVGVSPALQGLVHALPGIYTDSPDVGNQAFPIVMRPYIHVQGAGAKECVLRVRQGPPNFARSTLWPLATGLTRVASFVGVDFTEQTATDIPSTFDGFTIQGADVQVYAETEIHARSGQVSNCVFDMRDGGDELLIGPSFGVLVAAIYFGESDVAYYDMDFRLFNNTFLQGVLFDGDADVAIPENVAICNCNDPAPPSPFPEPLRDPDPTIRGVSSLHIQNNVIRCLDADPRTATLGIDLGDTSVIVSSRPGAYNTNAFDQALIGGVSVDPAGTFGSAIVGAPPVAVVDLGPADPGFVGEYLSTTVQAPARIRDAHILPDSLMVDMGATPTWGDECSTGVFTAGNGRVHLDSRTAEVISAFDYDGDGHGNPRVEGLDIDLGYDEFGQVTIAGSYGNDTKSHFLSYDPLDVPVPRVDGLGLPLVPVGTADRDLIFAGPTQFWAHAQFVAMPIVDVWSVTGGYTHIPGTVAFPVAEFAPGAPLPAGMTTWIDMLGAFTGLPGLVSQLSGPFNSTAELYVNPESGQVHGLDRFRWVVPEAAPAVNPTYTAIELQILDPAVGFVRSNLMAEYL